MLTSPRAIRLFITLLSHKSLPFPLTGSEISHYKPLGEGIYLLESLSHISLPVPAFLGLKEEKKKESREFHGPFNL